MKSDQHECFWRFPGLSLEESGFVPTQQIIVLAFQLFETEDETALTVTRLKSGTINEIYLLSFSESDAVRQLLLKVGNSNWRSSKTINEVSTMKYIRACAPHLPVPNILFWEPNAETSPLQREYIVMEYLEGVTLRSVWQSLPLSTRLDLVYQLIEVIVTFQSFTSDSIGNLDRDGNVVPLFVLADVYQGAPMSHFVDMIGAFVEKSLLKIGPESELFSLVHFSREFKKKMNLSVSLQLNFVHGDISDTNILVVPRGDSYKISGIVDFEWSFFGPKNLDLTRGFWWLKEGSQEDLAFWKVVEDQFRVLDDVAFLDYVSFEQTLSRIVNAPSYYQDYELQVFLLSEREKLEILFRKYDIMK